MGIADEELQKKIDAIMAGEKKTTIDGVGELTFKYRQVKKLDLGLSSEEMLLLPDDVLDRLSRQGRGVDLAVYKRLKEDGAIKGEAFGDLGKVKAFAGAFTPLKEHLLRQSGLFRGYNNGRNNKKG